MFEICLTVANREAFNELANRDTYLDSIRNDLDQDKWLSDECELFSVNAEQRNVIKSIWDIIN